MKFSVGSKNDPFLLALNKSIDAFQKARPMGLYEEACDGYLGRNPIDQFSKFVSNSANQLAKKSLKITEKTIDSVCKGALKSYEAVKWMGKKAWEGLKIAYKWLAEALKKAFHLVVAGLKKFFALLKKLLFEKICGIAKKQGSLDGFDDLSGEKVKTTIKSLGCAFEKHFANESVKAELIASALGLLGTFVGATVATGGAAAATAGAGMSAAGAAAALLAGRHAASVIALSFAGPCKTIKPVNPEKDTQLTVGEAEGLGQGILLIGGLAALSIFAFAKSGDFNIT